ncbi:MAG: hypothetical protein PHT12_06215 [Patescibacteria group bacterium]|nr:hypothetical protein [Patescibacteria group bacterium]
MENQIVAAVVGAIVGAVLSALLDFRGHSQALARKLKAKSVIKNSPGAIQQIAHGDGARQTLVSTKDKE